MNEFLFLEAVTRTMTGLNMEMANNAVITQKQKYNYDTCNFIW